MHLAAEAGLKVTIKVGAHVLEAVSAYITHSSSNSTHIVLQSISSVFVIEKTIPLALSRIEAVS